MAMVTAGCLDGNDDDGNGNGPPPEGTTEGFTFPDFRFSDQGGVVRHSASWGGEYTIVHAIASSEDVFEPQFAQIRAVMDHFENVTVEALTITSGNETLRDMEVLAYSMNISWAFGLPLTDLAEKLSLVKPTTVFVLDPEHVILERADGMLGQGRIVEAIEATWGVEPPEDSHPEAGSTVPDLVWRDIDGVEGRLSDLEGTPVILNVWEMECPFCLELFTELEKVWANHSADGLQMISVDLITWETPEQVRGVREQYNASWTFAIDGDNVQSRYDIWRLPLLVLLDDEGVVQWVWTGYVNSSAISEEVEKLI
jgi:peroxiredoxin